MSMSEKQPLIVILGPTAVGKTALSIELAKQLQTDIISGDSMLVYRGFDIGTAKPSMEERQGIRHELIDILPPGESFTVTDFCRLAGAKIAAIAARGKIPVLAGGTGLYVKSLLEGYRFNLASQDTAYRAELEQIAAEYGNEYLHAMLARVDSQAAARLHANDVRRVIRALEVAHGGTERISQEKSCSDGELCYNACVIGLNRERQGLYQRIEQRVDLMLERGLVQEVEGLLQAGVPREAQAMKGLGYKETAAYLAGELTLEQAIEKIKKGTRHFAKRQLTWYRKMPYIQWMNVDELTEKELFSNVLQKLAGFFSFVENK